jgi:hypothetical protein
MSNHGFPALAAVPIRIKRVRFGASRWEKLGVARDADRVQSATLGGAATITGGLKLGFWGSIGFREIAEKGPKSRKKLLSTPLAGSYGHRVAPFGAGAKQFVPWSYTNTENTSSQE